LKYFIAEEKIYNLNKRTTTMKNLLIILMPILILSIFSISQIYAQSSSNNNNNNNLKTCVDVYMKKFDEAVAKLDQKLQQQKDKLYKSENNSTFLKRISMDACVSSYKQTGKFGHLLTAKEQETFVTASFFKLMMEAKNKLNK
jgi:hypothetical protein